MKKYNIPFPSASLFGLLILINLCFLQSIKAQNNEALARTYIEQKAKEYQLSADDIQDWIITAQHTSSASHLTHIYCRQRYRGIEIPTANLSLHLRPDKSLFRMHNDFIPDLQSKINTERAGISAQQAIEAGAKDLGLSLQEPLSIAERKGGTDQSLVFGDAGISKKPIPARLVYRPMPGDRLELAWEVDIDPLSDTDVWRIWVDATEGKITGKENRTTSCASGESAVCTHAGHSKGDSRHLSELLSTCSENESGSADELPVQGAYRVFPLPITAPDNGGRSPVLDPDDPLASPFGWHDTDGATGAEFLDTRGNNVIAFRDNNGTLQFASGGSSLVFVFPYASNASLEDNTNAAITNAYYVGNKVHDILYHYGYNEASGNYQLNNYGNGGSGGDPMLVEIQESDNCGSDFTRTAEGFPSSVNLSVCDGVRDAGFSNVTIIHEYTHGLSHRLVGGPGQRRLPPGF